jgi:hypothetical protein
MPPTTRTIRVVVIEPTTPPEVRTIDPDTDLRPIIGGWLECLRVNDRVHAYIDEEGKIKGLTPNAVGTHLLVALGLRLRPGDWIVGPVVLCGSREDGGYADGEEHDLPEDVITVLTTKLNFL